MADEFKTRKDIEILYDLIYNRTTDSPVTQKSEYDTFRETIISDYATKQYVDDNITPVSNSLQGYIEDNNENISTINSSLSTLNTSVGTNTTDISSLKSRMTTAESNITTLDGQVNGSWNRIASTHNNYVQVFNRGRAVKIHIIYESDLTILVGSSAHIGTVPEGYRPFIDLNRNSYNTVLSVHTNGEIHIVNNSSADITIRPFEMIDYLI